MILFQVTPKAKVSETHRASPGGGGARLQVLRGAVRGGYTLDSTAVSGGVARAALSEHDRGLLFLGKRWDLTLE